MEQETNKLDKPLSYSSLKWLMDEGSTPLHFYKIWQKEKVIESTDATERGKALHAYILEREKFEKTYYVLPEITLDELNQFRIEHNIAKGKPVNEVRSNCIGYKELLDAKKFDLEITNEMIGISKSEMNHIMELRDNIESDPYIRSLMQDENNVCELRQYCEINGVKFSFVCDLLNKVKRYELDMKTIYNAFVTPIKASKLMGDNILQRACYNIFLRNMDIEIEDNYILAIDSFKIPMILRYDYNDMVVAEEKVSKTIDRFIMLKESGIFEAYDKQFNESGKIIPTNIPSYTYNYLAGEGDGKNDEYENFIDELQNQL